MPHPLPVNVVAPSIWRKLACLIYEGLLLLALLLIATFPFAGLKETMRTGWPLLLLQLYLLAVMSGYFLWFWLHGGQTLAMKTWRIQIASHAGATLRLPQALLRLLTAALFFGPAWVGLILLFFPHRISPTFTIWLFLPLCANILWALISPDKQFLHDRLARTYLVHTDSKKG